MADLKINIDKEKDLTTINVNGVVTADDISNAITNFYKNPTQFVIFDADNCQLNELSAVDLEKATKLIAQVKAHQSKGKTAFVMPKDDFSLGVLFEGLTKIENLPREYRSFTSHEEAERWIEQHCM